MKKPLSKTVLLFSGFAVLLKPSVVAAHLVTTGMGPVYDGIGHLLLTPEDLIPVVAVALYAGLRGKAFGKRALFVFPVAWLTGGLAGLLVNITAVFPLSVISFLILGALIAADFRLPERFFASLVSLVGILHGFFNGIAMQGGPGTSGLLGIMATLFVLVALLSAFIVSLQAHWTRIAVRVAGSWICAVGLLMLGWQMRGTI